MCDNEHGQFETCFEVELTVEMILLIRSQRKGKERSV